MYVVARWLVEESSLSPPTKRRGLLGGVPARFCADFESRRASWRRKAGGVCECRRRRVVNVHICRAFAYEPRTYSTQPNDIPGFVLLIEVRLRGRVLLVLLLWCPTEALCYTFIRGGYYNLTGRG